MMAQDSQSSSNWNPAGSQPPNAGTTEEGEVISFKENTTRSDDHLVAAGDYSDDAKGFDGSHDHSHPEGYEDRGAMDNPVHVDSLTDETKSGDADSEGEDGDADEAGDTEGDTDAESDGGDDGDGGDE